MGNTLLPDTIHERMINLDTNETIQVVTLGTLALDASSSGFWAIESANDAEDEFRIDASASLSSFEPEEKAFVKASNREKEDEEGRKAVTGEEVDTIKQESKINSTLSP